MKRIYFIYIIIEFFISYNLAAAEFMWPIDRPKRISGSFGEYRGIHFHHGIDIGCAGRKGFKIFAADDGYVHSVMYQKWGIGYAVFIKHKNGYSTVYGHMDRFSTMILKNSTIKKYYNYILNRKDFRIDFDKPEIWLNKGAVIGYSGDSGIGLEHLHFELRDKDNEPVNPLQFGLSINDSTAPIIKEIHLVPLDEYSYINGYANEAVFKALSTKKNKNLYFINEIPVVSGKIGIKITAYDHAGSRNKVSPYKIESFVNDEKKYVIAFDSIKKESSHKIGLYYDYDNSNYSHYSYFLYSRINKDGIIAVKDKNKIINLKIICYDAALNSSILSMSFKTSEILSKSSYEFKPNLIPNSYIKLFSKDNNFSIEFDKKSALYEEMITVNNESYESCIKNLYVKSEYYSVMPTNLCLDNTACISIKYTGDDYKKVGIYVASASNRFFYFLGNNYDHKKKIFTARVYKMGKFFLVRDDSPPVIRFYSNKKKINKWATVKLYVRDMGSGIDLSQVYLKVDEKDVFWDYDPDKRYIEILSHNQIWSKGKHTISIQVMDIAGNLSKKENFYYRI